MHVDIVGGIIQHLKTCHFRAEVTTIKQQKEKALCLFPVCPKAGYKLTDVRSLLSLPERTKINHNSEPLSAWKWYQRNLHNKF